MTKTSKSFVTEAAVISASNLVVKLIGVLFKIPLANLLGDSMGVFTAAYSIYAMLFMVSTSGLPVAISRLVSASAKRKRIAETNAIFRTSMVFFGILGLGCTFLLFFCADSISEWSRHSDAATAMKIIAPALLFVCLSSAIRGYFQGFRNMYPTAISQLIEAGTKLLLGLGLVVWSGKNGYSPVEQAAFAILGVTIGLFLGTCYLVAVKLVKKPTVDPDSVPDCEPKSTLLKKIALIALPVTITSSALYLSQFIDTLVINRCLISGGCAEAEAEKLYTAYTTLSLSISDLVPSTLVFPIATSILPAVAGALAIGNAREACDCIYSSIRISGIIALPAAFGVAVLSQPCINLIYGSAWGGSIITADGSTVTATEVGALALSILAIGIFFISLVSTTSALLQACGKPLYPLWSVLSGVALLTVTEITLVSNGTVGIYGAAISSVVCYVTAFTINLILLKKTGKVSRSLSVLKLFGKPFIAGGACGIAAWIVKSFLETVVDINTRAGSGLILVCSVAAGAIFYCATLIALHGISKEEVTLLPMGTKLAKLIK